MRVAVVAEYYPRRADPVLGIWAHRQAIAARDAGAAIDVFVLSRTIGRRSHALRAAFRQPRRETRDGLQVHYVSYASPPRRLSYARWSAWATPALRRALREAGPFDLIHAHNAVPAGDAALRCAPDLPLVVSVHGGDVLWTAARVPRGEATVRRVLGAARIVLANSAGIERLARGFGAGDARVVHLGSDLPPLPRRSPEPLVATVGHLVARKRHADVLRALAELPGVRYLIVGDGPERAALARLALELGIAERVELAGQLEPAAALARAREAWVFAMPSTAEAFGVAYIGAMAAGVPAIGCEGEPGPAEIAAAGAGIVLVPPRDQAALAGAIGRLIGDERERERLSRAARATIERSFGWPQCGAATVAAYEAALR